MKVQASNFSTSSFENKYINPGSQESPSSVDTAPTYLDYKNFEEGITNNTFSNFPIPQGSSIEMNLNLYRNASTNFTQSCDYLYFKFNRTFTSSDDYSDIIDWFNGDNIASTFSSANTSSGISFDYDTQEQTNITNWRNGTTTSGNTKVNFAWFKSTDSATLNEIKFLIRGFNACQSTALSSSGRAKIKASFKIILSDGTVIFETEPSESLPDVWYEGQDSYPVSALGFHESNFVGDTNQTSSVDGVFNLNFANCYSFGNGAESYKIRDSINGKEMSMGNRVTTVSEQDYKRAHRSSDITYSGLYNDETNLNRLNEFNLGLLNFKPLEASFGPINKMFARETDILTLQEDKISYVLSGKNLLSDASGGNVLTSVPEVLGSRWLELKTLVLVITLRVLFHTESISFLLTLREVL